MPQKEQIREMFDGIAPSYDRLNHLLSLGADKAWRRRSLRGAVTPDSPQNILDIACGTGDFSIEIARKMHPGSHVTSVDISEKMLEIMKDKVLAHNMGNKISIVNADAIILPFPDNFFNLATIAFGIRNFEDRQAALKEILRVLATGGKLLILELSQPSGPLLRKIYEFGFGKLAPWIGGMVSGHKKAYSYLPESIKDFPDKDKWMAIMRECGYKEVSHKAYTFGVCRLFTGIKE